MGSRRAWGRGLEKGAMNGRPLRLYAQLARSAAERPSQGVLFLFCTVTHGVAHAIMALVAGALVRGLALAPMDGRSTLGAVGGGPLGFAVAGLISAVVKLGSNVAAAHARASLVSHTVERVRLRVLDARLRGHVGQVGQADHGASGELAAPEPARALAALTTHVREVEVGLDLGVLRAGRALAELLPLIAALVLVDPWLALVAFGVLAPFAWALSRLRRGLKTRQARAVLASEQLLSAADDAVTHADLFRVFRAEARAREGLRRLAGRIAEASRFVTTRAALLSSSNEVLGALALVALVSASAFARPEQRAALVPFSVVFFMAYKPIRDLSDGRLVWAKGDAALAAMGTLAGDMGADLHGDGGDPPPSEGTRVASSAFTLEPLRLTGLVLPHVDLPPLDLTVAPGEVLAIVGPTGTGKTTLLRVLLGLEHPAAGEVRYGARALGVRDGPGERPFVWAPQEAPLVAGSVTDNVTLAGERLDAKAALVAVGAPDLTLADAEVERGERALSGGERQWVGLARAFASSRPVLLLDEPTSGLDAASQARVLAAIAALRGRRTVLLVTHRRDALGACDRVLDLARAEVRVFSGAP